MGKHLLQVFIITLLILLPRAPANAETILSDSFTDTTLTDLSKTTAFVDVLNGLVRLPGQALPNALALKQFGPGYVVVTTEGVKIMDYDEAGNTVVASYTIPVTDALGVSLRQDIPRMFMVRPDSLQQYDLDENLQTYAPGPMLTGLGEVLSVSTQPLNNGTFVLSKSGTGTGIINTIQSDESGQLQAIPGLSFDTGITDPVAVTVVPDTPDFVLSSTTGFFYYAFDDSSGTYIQDASRSLTGLNGILGITTDSQGYRVLTPTTTDYYLPAVSSLAQKVVDLSETPIESSVAISANTSNYDFGRLTSDGTVKYFSFDDSTGTIAEIPQLSSTGFQLTNKYSSPKVYKSVVRTASQTFDTVRLTPTISNDLNTSITYKVSIDGGVSWIDLLPNIWTTVPDSTTIILQATLTSNDTQYTPRLLDVNLETTKLSLTNLVVTSIALPPTGQPVPTSTFPVFIKAGAEFAFKVDTTGFAQQVSAAFTGGGTVDLIPSNPVDSDSNTWTGTYVIPPDAVDGDIFQVTLTGLSGISGKTAQLSANPFIVVNGSVLQDLQLMLTQ